VDEPIVLGVNKMGLHGQLTISFYVKFYH